MINLEFRLIRETKRITKNHGSSIVDHNFIYQKRFDVDVFLILSVFCVVFIFLFRRSNKQLAEDILRFASIDNSAASNNVYFSTK